MAKVVVEPGICGFTAVIEVTKIVDSRVRITINSDCSMVTEMKRDLEELNWQKALRKLVESPVYKAAGQHNMHAACPIPAAILKAIEVEVGAALPRDVMIHFDGT